MDSKAFARHILAKLEKNAEKLRREVFSKTIRLSEKETIAFLQSRSWAEYTLGIYVPAKLITMLPEQDMDIKMDLTQQMIDEFHHYQVFRKLVEDRGGTSDILQYKPGPIHLSILERSINHDNPAYIAASNNLVGEYMLTSLLKHMNTLLDPKTAKVIEEEVILHEGNHIRNGHRILERYATTEETQRRVEVIVDDRFGHLYTHYRHPYFEFIAPEYV